MTKKLFYNVLVADDDAAFFETQFRYSLPFLPDVEIHYSATIEETRSKVHARKFDLIFLDICFENESQSGIEILEEVKLIQPETNVYMLSGLDDKLTMAKCMALGAEDFLSKNDQTPSELLGHIQQFIERISTQKALLLEGTKIANEFGFACLSKAMQKVYKEVAFARNLKNKNILILGETGVGKDVFAKMINFGTGRKKVNVDCGAISESLAESELFGHIAGAFTGSIRNKIGKFQEANGGDLFFDELGNLPRSIQDMLLRAIQNKEVTPVGGNSTEKVDVRLIAATNADLPAMITANLFRQDLYERINVIQICIPPLRDRREDISPLIEFFIERQAKSEIKVAPSCLNLLSSYSWPGNIRELENACSYMIQSCGSGTITVKDFSPEFRRKLASELVETEEGNVAIPPGCSPLYIPVTANFLDAMNLFRREFITQRIKDLGEKPSRAALSESLGISRTTLRDYMKDLGIDLEEATKS